MKHIVILILVLSVLATCKEPLAPLVTKIIERKTQVPPDTKPDTANPPKPTPPDVAPKPAEPEPVVAPKPAEPKPVVAPKPTEPEPELTNAAQAEWDKNCDLSQYKDNPRHQKHMAVWCQRPSEKAYWYQYTWPAIQKVPLKSGVWHMKSISKYDNTLTLNIAIKDLTKAIQLNPNSAPAYAYRGIAYVGLEQFTQAKQDLAKAHTLQPRILHTDKNIHARVIAMVKVFKQRVADAEKRVQTAQWYVTYATDNLASAYEDTNAIQKQIDAKLEEYRKKHLYTRRQRQRLWNEVESLRTKHRFNLKVTNEITGAYWRSQVKRRKQNLVTEQAKLQQAQATLQKVKQILGVK